MHAANQMQYGAGVGREWRQAKGGLGQSGARMDGTIKFGLA